MAMTIRVHISDSNISKLQVPSDVDTLDKLKVFMTERFTHELAGKCFILQYFDTDFKDFCNVETFKDITNLSTIKVIATMSASGENSDENSSQSWKPTISNERYESSGQSLADVESSSPSVSGRKWPEVFPLPNFNDIDATVFLYLQKHKLETCSIKTPEHVKRKIVQALCTSVSKYTLYPKSKDLDNICFSLIREYPFLRDSSPGGHSSWAIAMRYKVCNMRKSLKGISKEVDRNSRKDGKGPHTGIKKARRGITVPLLSPEDKQESDESEQHLQQRMKEVLTGRGKQNIAEVNSFPSASLEKVGC